MRRQQVNAVNARLSYSVVTWYIHTPVSPTVLQKLVTVREIWTDIVLASWKGNKCTMYVQIPVITWTVMSIFQVDKGEGLPAVPVYHKSLIQGLVLGQPKVPCLKAVTFIKEDIFSWIWVPSVGPEGIVVHNFVHTVCGTWYTIWLNLNWRYPMLYTEWSVYAISIFFNSTSSKKYHGTTTHKLCMYVLSFFHFLYFWYTSN